MSDPDQFQMPAWAVAIVGAATAVGGWFLKAARSWMADRHQHGIDDRRQQIDERKQRVSELEEVVIRLNTRVDKLETALEHCNKLHAEDQRIIGEFEGRMKSIERRVENVEGAK